MYYSTFQPWMWSRVYSTLRDVYGDQSSMLFFKSRFLFDTVLLAARDLPELHAEPGIVSRYGGGRPSTDDWPFMYLERPTIAPVYLQLMAVVAALIAAAFALLRRLEPTRGLRSEFLLLGLGFTLLESSAIVRLSLLFGSTWTVNVVVFSSALVMVFLANLSVQRRLAPPLRFAWPGLLLFLVANWAFPLPRLLELDFPGRALLCGTADRDAGLLRLGLLQSALRGADRDGLRARHQPDRGDGGGPARVRLDDLRHALDLAAARRRLRARLAECPAGVATGAGGALRRGRRLMRSLRAWAVLCLALGGGLAFAAREIAARGGVAVYEQPALGIARGEGLALAAAGLLAALLCGWAPRGLAEPPATAARVAARPYLTLFLVSFIALFVELMLIRYCASQIRIFAFYKNVPLIGCYLGLGLGCFLARGDARHARAFLLWMIPVAVGLSAGSLLASNALGKLAAIGTSEHMLGDYVPRAAGRSHELASQLLMAGFCVTTLVVITLLFALLGRLLGEAFERVPRLPAYTANIAGSLAGILGFLGFSLLETPPPLWFAAGLAPLAWWAARPRDVALFLGLAALCCAAVLPSYGDTVWSRYQKLVGHEIPVGGGTGYLVEISDVFYQIAVDRRPERLASGARDPFPHYGLLYQQVPRPDHVLIVGAGTGNDVAAALHAGASQVDAVDIDPAIVRMGRLHHPERPYDDPRVHVVVDDARHAFRALEPARYDLVVFGLLDSHTQLGVSSVRLDNYVFTVESLGEARRLLAPGGRIAVTAAVFEPWFGRRLETMLAAATGGTVDVTRNGYWTTFLGPPEGEAEASGVAPPDALRASLPSDDWPFLYLPERAVPAAYLWVVGAMAVASVLVLRLSGLPFARFDRYHGHLFFLGAAFLLMEVHAINRLALLFGTTWLVSGLTIALVLVLILAANLTMMAFERLPYAIAYAGLALSLAASFLAAPGDVIGRGSAAALGLAVVLLSPVYFAGLVFARSFRRASLAGAAIGANILGSVLGGWVEYSTMALGVRALLVLAALFYGLSLALLARSAPARAD